MSSIMVAPRDQISAAVVIPFNSMTSGATIGNTVSMHRKIKEMCHLLQFGLPTTSSLDCPTALKLRDTPKSESLMLPVLVVSILAALRSQCTTCSNVVSQEQRDFTAPDSTYILRMKVVQSFQDLGHIPGDKIFIKLAK